MRIFQSKHLFGHYSVNLWPNCLISKSLERYEVELFIDIACHIIAITLAVAAEDIFEDFLIFSALLKFMNCCSSIALGYRFFERRGSVTSVLCMAYMR